MAIGLKVWQSMMAGEGDILIRSYIRLPSAVMVASKFTVCLLLSNLRTSEGEARSIFFTLALRRRRRDRDRGAARWEAALASEAVLLPERPFHASAPALASRSLWRTRRTE